MTLPKAVENAFNQFLKFQNVTVEKIATPYSAGQDSLIYWRAMILFSILFTGLVLAIAPLVASIALYAQEGVWQLALSSGLGYIGAFYLLFSEQIRYETRATLSLLICFSIGLAVIVSVGPLSGGPAWLFAFAVLAGVLLGPKPAIMAILLNAITLATTAWLISTGRMGHNFPFFNTSQAMVAAGANFIFLNAIAAVSVSTLVKGLALTHEKEKILSLKLIKEQKALSESVASYQSFIDNAPIAIYTVNTNGEFTYGNRKLLKITGYKREDWLNKPFHPIVHPEDLDLVLDKVQKRVDGKGSSEPYEIRIFHATGDILWVEIVSESIFDVNEEGIRTLVGMQSFLTDITDKKKAETALQESGAQFRNIVNASPMGIHLYELENEDRLVFVGANLASDELLGIPYEQFVGKTIEAAFPGLVDTEIPERYRIAAKDGTTWRTEQIDYHEGSIHGAFEVVAFQTEPNKMAVLFNEITQRKKAEAALQESEERFRTLVEKSPLGISLIGEDGSYKYVNPQFGKMFGYTVEDIPTGRDWFRAAFPEKIYRREVVDAWIKDQQHTEIGESRPREYTVTCKDGTRKEIDFRPVTMENRKQFVIYEDITERLRLEQQLQQAQKFEAIGTLAGGIAHDFNNLLMGIQGRASLMSFELPSSHPHSEHIGAIEEYIRSATGLTKQILGFARGGKYKVRPFEINDLVLNSADMFGRTKKEIKIQTKLHDPSPVVAADRTQIEQVLLNLFVNAWQAMPDGGEIYLATRAVQLDALYCKPHETKPGHYVKISLADMGVGMDETVRQRIFDPFFTTKAKSRGTGLGLASAYGIIKNHGGMITVHSEPGHGTTFNIYLPASDQKAYRPLNQDKETVRGSETVLLVDDEDMIIDVGTAMLEKLGYTVVVARDGQQAVDMVLKKPDNVDLVVLDMIMPGMDGGKAFDLIREIKPELPVILSSGYSINGQATDILNRGCDGFIQKPFNITELSQTIRKTLDG